MRYVLYGFIGLMLLLTIPLIVRIISFTPTSTNYDSYIQSFFDHEAVLDFDKQYAMFSEEKQKKLGSLTNFSKAQMAMIRRTRQETKGRKALLQKIDVSRELSDDVELTAFISRGPLKETYLFVLQKTLGEWRISKYEELRVVDFSSMLNKSAPQEAHDVEVNTEVIHDRKLTQVSNEEEQPEPEEDSSVGSRQSAAQTSSRPTRAVNPSFEDRSAGFQNLSKEKVKSGVVTRNEPMQKANDAKQTIEGLLSDAEAMGVISKDEYEKRAKDLNSLNVKK